ncbi:ABC transporter permease [Natranaerobius trueperi]|uniref:Spermidine/putrescine ABC transporter permease n=1 Tax=Natranaerobius trueperi TaxID=759412 RepID=A0A226BW01_9FIRM|nr:ABC transporter permease [Natranaerobius trueperi]OWZ83176.1 spermidine/putrescine ABC transporter permease [Natranaerobius trueperi]
MFTAKKVLLLISPGLLFLVIFQLIPLFSIFMETIQVGGEFSLERYGDFFKDPYNMNIYFRTLRIALISTLIAVTLGFPTSYFISKSNIKKRGLYIALAVFPLLTSPVVRSFSWIVVLGRQGLVNNFLTSLNIIEEPLSILYTEAAIIIGFVHLFLPLMILSLVGVMENIDHNLVLAAESLGASKLKAFLKIVFPLSLPGVVIGSVLVFCGSFTAYTTPQLLGGSRTRVMATLLYENARTLNDWTTASVIATIMILTTMAIITVINRGAKKLNPKG